MCVCVCVCVCVCARWGLMNDPSPAVSFRWDVFPKQGLNIYHVHPQIQMDELRDGRLERMDEWMKSRRSDK